MRARCEVCGWASGHAPSCTALTPEQEAFVEAVSESLLMELEQRRADMEPSAENDAYTWVVHDMAHEHRLCLDPNHPAEFGLMTEAQARRMESRNPRGYWAQNLAAKSVTPPVKGDQ